MNTILYEPKSSEDIRKLPEIMLPKTTQSLTASTTMEDMNTTSRFHDFTHRLDDNKKKSLISIYDNNPQQQSHSLVGIIGRNRRSQAFTKRLILSGFPKPILYDINTKEINPNDHSNYVSYETFYQHSPSIVLITENFTTNFEEFFPQHKQQLIIDTREILSTNAAIVSPCAYRAFGNLSDWEIEHGSERTPIAIEQFSPTNLIKFIHDLKSFSRGILFLDSYSYQNQSIKSFRNCLFPLITTILIFTFWFILSIIEQNQETINIYRQASSITALTSITLLALVFFIRPFLELIEFIYSIISNKSNLHENTISNFIFIQRWLQSRRYLSWYSLSLALLHLLFVFFFKFDLSIYAFVLGIFALILLIILSFVHFPSISERLLWKEYHFLTAYLGPFSLFLAFLHLYLYWDLQSHLFNLKFLSLIFPLIVLILRFIIYGILRPIQWFRSRQDNTS